MQGFWLKVYLVVGGVSGAEVGGDSEAEVDGVSGVEVCGLSGTEVDGLIGAEVIPCLYCDCEFDVDKLQDHIDKSHMY